MTDAPRGTMGLLNRALIHLHDIAEISLFKTHLSVNNVNLSSAIFNVKQCAKICLCLLASETRFYTCLQSCCEKD